ncbi:hypothetical protein [Aureimonas ureilytica]|uniref:hypothetical protein n=1 Tax=Aureimonas ureilytica TaxID=401562 RepID=UPI000373CF64|nr:hypothetical protein [Aureimonas ureilytica]
MKLTLALALLSLTTPAASAQSLVPGSDYFLDQADGIQTHRVATDDHHGGDPSASNLTHEFRQYGYPLPRNEAFIPGLIASSHATKAEQAVALKSVVEGTSHVPVATTEVAPSFLVPGSSYGRR